MAQEASCLDKEEFQHIVRHMSFVSGMEQKEQPADFYVDNAIASVFEVKGEERMLGAGVSRWAIDTILPEIAFEGIRKQYIYPVFSFREHGIKQPFNIIIECSEIGKAIVWSEEFRVSGVGESVEEAFDYFENLIYSDFRSLSQIPAGNLSDGAKELLQRYNNYLEL